jgi:hypothetical protein
MGGGMGTQVRGIERPPLTACAQDIENGIGTLSVGDPGAPSAKAMGVLVHRHDRLEH